MPDLTAGVDELLQQINDAVQDWEVSRDAMRCNAPPAILRNGEPTRSAPSPVVAPGVLHIVTSARRFVQTQAHAAYRRLRDLV